MTIIMHSFLDDQFAANVTSLPQRHQHNNIEWHRVGPLMVHHPSLLPPTDGDVQQYIVKGQLNDEHLLLACAILTSQFDWIRRVSCCVDTILLTLCR